MKISSTETVGINALKILVFGESGTGKTTLAGTIKEPTLVISAEAGLLSLHGKKIDVIDIASDDNGTVIPPEKRIARLGEVYQYLITEDARKRYKSVFIDSLSEINQCLLSQLNLEFPERKDSLPMYGEMAKRMKSLIKTFRDLPYFSIIFSALSSVEKDENGTRYVAPQLVGKMSEQIGAYFDEVFFLHIDKETGERKLITSKTDNVLAKDRSGKLDKSEKADLGLIYNKIRGNKQ